MHRVNVILLSVGMAFLVTPSTAAGRRLHLTCQDGDPQVLLDGRPAPFDQATCDSVADGVCAFTVFQVPFVPCACPTIGCCETTVTSEVPLNRKKRIPRGSYSLVLRCLPLAHTVPCEGPDASTVHLSTDIQPIFDRSCWTVWNVLLLPSDALRYRNFSVIPFGNPAAVAHHHQDAGGLRGGSAVLGDRLVEQLEVLAVAQQRESVQRAELVVGLGEQPEPRDVQEPVPRARERTGCHRPFPSAWR